MSKPLTFFSCILPAHEVLELPGIRSGKHLRVSSVAILDRLDAGDSVAPVVPNQLIAPLQKTLLLLQVPVVVQLSFHFKQVLPALARHLQLAQASLIFLDNLWLLLL